MLIRLTEDRALADQIREALKKNGGYCPCSLTRGKDTRCMCKEFREMKEGVCHCGLYIKTAED